MGADSLWMRLCDAFEPARTLWLFETMGTKVLASCVTCKGRFQELYHMKAKGVDLQGIVSGTG